MKLILFGKYVQLLLTMKSNAKLLEFVVAQFLWVALTHKFTYSMETNFERQSFLTETEYRCIYKITIPRIRKKAMKIAPPPPPSRPGNLNDSTVTNKQYIAIYGQQKSLGFCI